MTAAELTDKLGELHSLTKPVDFDRSKEQLQRTPPVKAVFHVSSDLA
jgi:hypothetical protein